MASTTITLYVSYSQIAVFASELKEPFNNWTQRHVAQGFAWRPGSVSFGTLVEAGVHSVDIDIVDHAEPVSAEAVRVIEVPFEVPPNGAIEVGSISESKPLSLTPGTFLLRCEFLRPSQDGNERIHLVFARKDTPRFAVVRADESLSVVGELLTTASVAHG